MKKNKINQDKSLIISVESQKGGVGKTTAAFCFGKLLLDKGYEVLMLDLDITGTDAGVVAKNSPFLMDYAFPIKSIEKKDKNANLLYMFERHFMTGKLISEFTIDPQAEGYQLYKPIKDNTKKINIFGSSIFDEDGEKAITRPEVLFDELHSYWLIEFVQHIIEKFESTFPHLKRAVLLDSSPGYVGLTPAIHDWLTDRGPDYSKFLSIATLDEQDMFATKNVIDILTKKHEDKWRTKCTFDRLSKPNALENALEEVPYDKKFFMRLASNDKRLDYYNNSKIDNDPIDYKKYVGVVLNSISEAIYKRKLTYKLKIDRKADKEIEKMKLIQLLGTRNHSSYWNTRLVPFDLGLRFQYASAGLIPDSKKIAPQLKLALGNLQMTRGNISRFIEELEYINPVNSDQFYPVILSKEKHRDFFKKIINQIKILFAQLRTLGLAHIADLFDLDWLPEYIVGEAREALRNIIREKSVPLLWNIPFEIDTGPVNTSAVDFLNTLDKRVIKLLRKNHPEFFDKQDNCPKELIKSFSSYLSTLVGFTLTDPIWHQPHDQGIVELLTIILHFEAKHWSKSTKLNSPKFNKLYNDTVNQYNNNQPAEKTYSSRLFKFLVAEKLSINEIKEYLDSHKKATGKLKMLVTMQPSLLSDYYASITTLQARFMTVKSDADFIVELLERILFQVSKQKSFIPYLHDVVEEVIINKSRSSYDSFKKIDNMIKTVNYHKRFQKVLKSICTKWGI